MAKFLGKEVKIENLKLYDWLREKKDGNSTVLEQLDLYMCMEIIEYCSGIPVENIKKAVNEDMGMIKVIFSIVTDGVKIKDENQKEPVKKQARPLKKMRP